MLKKKLCIDCWNRIPEGSNWIGYDETNWEEGRIVCPLKFVEIGEKMDRKITEPPPSKCPYFLENVL